MKVFPLKVLLILLIFECQNKLTNPIFLHPEIITNRKDLWVERRIYSYKPVRYPGGIRLTCRASVPIVWDFDGKFKNTVTDFTSKRIVDIQNPNNPADFIFEISTKIEVNNAGANGRYICKSIQYPNISDFVFVLMGPQRAGSFDKKTVVIKTRLDQKEVRLPCVADAAPVIASLFKLITEGGADRRVNITGLPYVRYDLTLGFDLITTTGADQKESPWGEYECTLEYFGFRGDHLRISVIQPDDFVHSPQIRDSQFGGDIFCSSKDPIEIRYNYPIYSLQVENTTYYENQSLPYRYNAILKVAAGYHSVVECFNLKTNKTIVVFETDISNIYDVLWIPGEVSVTCVLDGRYIETFECDVLAECTFLGNPGSFYLNENPGAKVKQSPHTRPLFKTQRIRLRPIVATCSTINLDQAKRMFVLDLDRNFFEFTDKINRDNSSKLVRLGSHQPESYLGEKLTVTCSFVRFFLGDVHWAFKYQNGSVLFLETPKDGDQGEIVGFIQKQNRILVMNDEFIEQILCYAPFSTSYDWAIATSDIIVKEKHAPFITGSNTTESLQIDLAGEDTRLFCEVTGHPQFNITWEGDFLGRNNSTVIRTSDVSDKKSISTLTILGNTTIEEDKSFSCIASNKFGSTKKTFTITVPKSPLHPGIIVGIVATVIIAIIVTLFLFRAQRRKLQELQNRLTENDIKGFLDGAQSSSSAEEEFDPYGKPFPDNANIAREDIEIGQVLGFGAYGIVFKGTFKISKKGDTDTDKTNPGLTVAIKTLKQGSNIQYVRSLLSEIKTMVHVENHEHVVKFYGACIQNIQQNEIYVVLEFCVNGSLESYLRKNRSDFENTDPSQVEYNNLNTNVRVTTRNLLQWSQQIVSAMSYLAQKKVVHGDLATRNVLLTQNLITKVADFGLAKHMYNYSQFTRKKGEALLPWRWMAVESLRDMEFSIRSDVWSFGVTLWEIFSLAEVPYGGLGYTLEFVNMLKLGFRLVKPIHASNQM